MPPSQQRRKNQLGETTETQQCTDSLLCRLAIYVNPYVKKHKSRATRKWGLGMGRNLEHTTFNRLMTEKGKPLLSPQEYIYFRESSHIFGKYASCFQIFCFIFSDFLSILSNKLNIQENTVKIKSQ